METKRTIWIFTKRLLLVFLVVVAGLLTVEVAGILMMGIMGPGERYTREGNALSKKVFQTLIQEGFCTDLQDCNKKEPLFGEDGDRVHLNIYGITDHRILSGIFTMVASEGMKTTNGVPITLTAFQKPKKEYMGFNSFFKESMIKLEINE